MAFKFIKNSLFILSFSLLSTFAHADANISSGIALGATRVIYPLGAKQVSLPVINHSTKERFLINSWVDNEQGKDKNFVVTPPLFVIEAKSENTLRIVNLSSNLPNDRESIFWLNVKSIPSLDQDELEGKNVLQLAILSRIKIFIRPSDLPIKPEEAILKLSFNRKGNGINIENPTPYYITIVKLTLDNKELDNVMVSPFSSHQIENKTGKKLSYQTINDYGGLTKKTELLLK